MNTLKSENERYGFYGTMSLDGCADAAWEIAMTLIAEDTGADGDGILPIPYTVSFTDTL